MATFLTVSDLEPFIPHLDTPKAQALIDDATAIAVSEAPCLSGAELTAEQAATVKAVLRSALVRYIKGGEQPTKSWEQAGPYAIGFQAQPLSRGTFFPSELKALRKVCASITGQSGAFVIDTVPFAVPVTSRSGVVDSVWLTDIEA